VTATPAAISLVPAKVVTGTPVEGDAWEAAARTYLDEVSRALEELYRAHGGRSVRLDLFAEERRWRERECAALGRTVTFAEWWDTVTVYEWTTDEFAGRLRSRVGRHRRDSSDHRAFGGYGGDWGTAGHDAGGHSAGFGTSF